MKLCQNIKSAALMALLFSSQAVAQQSEPLLNFKFDHLSNITNSERVSLHNTDVLTAAEAPLISESSLKFSQYDVTWIYPWENNNINLDLGVTFRHLSGATNDALNNVHFQQTLPLLHASALYNFSPKGLSAAIEGNHLTLKDSQIFDYRAQVSYEWREGFGMQGGWKHQQFNLDKAAETGTNYEQKGPFIDFYLHF